MFFAPRDPRACSVPLPRSLYAFAAFAAGLAIGRSVPIVPAGAWLASASAACAVAGLVQGRACRWGLFVAAMMLGAGWFCVRLAEAPAHDLSMALHPFAPPAPATIEGVVLDTPRLQLPERDPLSPLAPFTDPRWRFLLDADTAVTDSGPRRARGVVRIAAAGVREGMLSAGDRVRVTGELAAIAPPMNPGERDRRLWAFQDGVAGTMRVPNRELICPLPPRGGIIASARSAVLRWRAVLRQRVRDALLPDDQPDSSGRALLGALLLGEAEPGLADLRSAFVRLGLAHVLAISGFHLTVMASVALFVLRLTGDRGWVEPAIIAALVAAYLFILPVQAPVWRSGLLTLALLAADACGRRYQPLALLGWVAVALLIWRPMDLWSIGFQLSFGLVALLMWLGITARRRLFAIVLMGPEPRSREPIAWAWDQLRAYISNTLLCWVTAAPFVAFHTGLVSLAGFFTGLVILPPILFLLAFGYAVLFLGAVLPSTGAWAGRRIESVAGWTASLVRWMDGVPHASFSLPTVSLAWAAAATAVALYWFARAHRRDRPAWAMTILVLAWLAAEVRLGPRLPSSVGLRLDTFAVGDGTCHLLRAGSDALLWDCGSLTPGVGRTLVPRAVRALGAWRVPTVVVSHSDLDHFNGLLDAAGPLGVRLVCVGESFHEEAEQHPGSREAFLLDELARRGVAMRVLRAGDTLPLGALTLAVLSPPPTDAGPPWPGSNDRSLVAEVVVPGDGTTRRRLLLTGDIERRAIDHLALIVPRLRADVMEAPHHGSVREPAARFIAETDPAVVIQSTGPGRVADERWDAVRGRRRWFATATDGAAWVEFRRDGSLRSGSTWRR